MNKILIIGFDNFTFLPFMQPYEEMLKKLGIAYDRIIFDRRLQETVNDENTYIFRKNLGTEHKTDIRTKIFPYIQYRKYVCQLIKQNQYDKLIVLTVTPAILISDLLLRHYKGKYIFDYRDLTFLERFSLFKRLVNKISKESYATIVSSKGFVDYYIKPHDQIYETHNITNIAFLKTQAPACIKKPINIGFVGAIRYYDANTKLIQTFANSEEVNLVYSGINHDNCDLRNYCLKNGIKNVRFTGMFSNEEKPKLYENISLINALYSLQSPDTLRAIPNKLYDAAIFKIPILVTQGTYLGKVVKEWELGCVIDISESTEMIYSQILEYVNSYDSDAFERACQRFLKKVENDMRVVEKVIERFVSE